MKLFRTYRWFQYLKAVIGPLMMVVMLASQFPLSSHFYDTLFGKHSSGKMMCMIDGTCMMKMASGQTMECQCHKKHADRPFFCSCSTSAQELISTLQLSKVLLPELTTAEGHLVSKAIPILSTDHEPSPTSKDIFHPPQLG